MQFLQLKIAIREEIIAMLDKLFFEGVWECYFREIKEKSVLDEKAVAKNWHKLEVPRRYWCADPFVVSDGKDDWVFCELMDRKISRGLLGIGKLSSTTKVEISVLSDLGCHTSYPNVFAANDNWYMIPETVDRRSIELYIATKFPYRWKKVATLLDKVDAVDTTAFFIDRRVFLFIYEEKGFDNKLSVAELDLNSFTLKRIDKAVQYNSKIGRPGGNIIQKNDQMLRPTQYGVNHYGEALVFKKFEYNPQIGDYYEEDTIKICPKDIMPERIAKKSNGMHTYNRNGKYEVIDIHRKAFFIERPFVSLLKKYRVGGFRYYVRKK